jgi:hypothetical protein
MVHDTIADRAFFANRNITDELMIYEHATGQQFNSSPACSTHDAARSREPTIAAGTRMNITG